MYREVQYKMITQTVALLLRIIFQATFYQYIEVDRNYGLSRLISCHFYCLPNENMQKKCGIVYTDNNHFNERR